MVTYCVIAILIGLIGLFEILVTGFSDSTVSRFGSGIPNLLFQSCLPIAFFIYICFSVCPQRKKMVTFFQAKRKRTSVQTAGLQTVPPSTRVSLPSDTAAHAPNFLSPSGGDASEVSSLLV